MTRYKVRFCEMMIPAELGDWTHLGQRDVGNNHDVHSAGSILRSSVGVTTGVVLVLASGLTLPRHGVLGHRDLGLRSGRGRRASWERQCQPKNQSNFPESS